ncbi:MAG: PD-(D/E)XK motif protein [Spiroplasma ixodetis]|nr:PD-(D/E)XK motif protein [Spiroplasma ixodetis]
MEINELFNELKKMKEAPVNSFNVIKYNQCYYGVDKDKNIVFLSNSLNHNERSLAQETNQLYLGQNISCLININEKNNRDVFDIIICFDKDPKHIITFLHLTNVYVKSSKPTININTFFDSLKILFASKKQLSIFELQGLYGELYFIDYMNSMGIDIGQFWQSQEKMKFDFSIDETKKIEVKTTTNDTRKHKFRHEQLVSDIYETWIVSLLLRKDDQGLSLFDLSEKVKKKNPQNIQLHTNIIKLLNNYSEEQLKSIKFNNNYTKKNIGFYNTIYIPKFKDKQPIGVTNTEYESNLTLIESRSILELINWLKINNKNSNL